jgi:hypothetical protein
MGSGILFGYNGFLHNIHILLKTLNNVQGNTLFMGKESPASNCGCGTKFHNYSVGILAWVLIAMMAITIIGVIVVIPMITGGLSNLGDLFSGLGNITGGP